MNLLVAFDGSEASKRALKLAEDHAKILDAKIDVANAIDRWVQFREIQSAEQILEQEVGKLLNGDNISYETHLLVDLCPPGKQLVNFAKQKNIDEIIIGTRKRSKVGKFIFGSTTQYVVLNAPCPVVTTK